MSTSSPTMSPTLLVRLCVYCMLYSRLASVLHRRDRSPDKSSKPARRNNDVVLGNCKVAGSNLTCRDDWKTRWRLHSVDLTSTGISSPGQNVIHSPVARVVYG